MTDKERLENMSPIGFDLNGNVLLKGDDYHWLMEQAERVQELESKLNKQIEIGYKFEGEVYDLAKENKRYREAINNINKKAVLFGTSDEVYDAIQDAIKVLEEIE